jgi:hypothetical protein
MNQQFNFDNNIYNAYIYHSGGFHPTFHQYQHFASTLYNNHMYCINLQAQQLQFQQSQQSQQLQFQQSPEVLLEVKEKISVCIYGMRCKNIKCLDYHHPSKDLDIINSSKVK